jgi:hypothetical protein
MKLFFSSDDKIDKIDNRANTVYLILTTGLWKTIGREYGYVKDRNEFRQIHKLYRIRHKTYKIYIGMLVELLRAHQNQVDQCTY